MWFRQLIFQCLWTEAAELVLASNALRAIAAVHLDIGKSEKQTSAKIGNYSYSYHLSGNTTDYCGTGCTAGYGRCDGVPVTVSWQNAVQNAKLDAQAGGEYYWDPTASLFWTWDTPSLINRKFQEIVAARGLGGVMAWSLGEDSYDWSHLKALQTGVKQLFDY